MAVDISPEQNSGVLKEILKEGEGDETPSTGCKVTVHYTGTLLDGTKFDSSRDRDQPFTFNLGRSEVIQAWDIGVATMKKGELAMLTCAPEKAYGKSGSPPKIPPSATLKFEIEVISWIGDDVSVNKDGGVERVTITSGKDVLSPTDGALVDVHLTGKYNGKIFEDKSLSFTLGEGEEAGVIEGVEHALSRFKIGELSRLKIKSKYAFGKTGSEAFNIPPDADVEYTVNLKNFEKAADIWSLEPPQKLEQAKIYKEKATKYFKAGKYQLAIKMCKKIEEYLSPSEDFPDELQKECADISLSGFLNLALFYLKVEDFLEAKVACDEVLGVQQDNEKALFRRGQAQLGLAAPEAALQDFQQVLKVQPNNAAASKQIAICSNLIKQNLSREKKLYANMFEKFAQADKQKEDEKLKQLPDVMKGTLGEWGQEERPGGRDATAFEKENPNILMLNANGTGEFKNM